MSRALNFSKNTRTLKIFGGPYSFTKKRATDSTYFLFDVVSNDNVIVKQRNIRYILFPAGSIIRMMSHIMKPDVFQKGLQAYLKAK